MSFEAPDYLPELSAATEVAVYRIAPEALTNVVCHAHAQHCDMLLELDETKRLLTLSMQDDGCGLPAMRSGGVGLISMRERAEELGGTWTIAEVPSGGTQVLAQFPYLQTEIVDEMVATPIFISQAEVDTYRQTHTSYE